MKNLSICSALLTFLLVSCDENNSMNSSKEVALVTSSNTTGKISFTDLSETTPMAKSFTISSLDAEGVSYDKNSDEITVVSRTNNRIETYKGIKNSIMVGTDNIVLSINSMTGDFTNARETAVSGDKIVVAQDENASNGLVNKLLLYQKSSSGFTLLKTFTPKFKLWGIHMDGNNLYAVVDLTGDIVVYENFINNTSGDITPTKRVSIEGLIRSHGITYSSKDDVMILTDVASAASATDGGLIVINNFSRIFAATSNQGTIAMMSQIRIYGSNTLLGNPVDVAYDYFTNSIYVAERLNAGGQVLTFAFPTTSGNFAPTNIRSEAGVTSIFLLRK